MTNKFKLIEGSITEGSQSVNFKYLCAYGKLRVRFSIKSDAYCLQCSAIAQVWSAATLSWNAVAGLAPAEMETPVGLCYHRQDKLDERHFMDDYDHLQRLVAATLDVE